MAPIVLPPEVKHQRRRLPPVFMLRQTLRALARDCISYGNLEASCAYVEKALPLLEDPEEKEACLLSLGQAREDLGEYSAAREAYSRAFQLPQELNEIWYFLNNNLAYCLNLSILFRSLRAARPARVGREMTRPGRCVSSKLRNAAY